MSFWCLQFYQKTNENNSTWGTIVVKLISFVRFLGELKITKRHFEINWPLVFVCNRGCVITSYQNDIYLENKVGGVDFASGMVVVALDQSTSESFLDP